MRYRGIGLAGLGVAAALGLSACNNDDLVRVNQDPNNPTSAPPQPVFTYATRVAMQRFFGRNPMNMTGPVLTGQQLAESQYPDEDQYLRLDGTVTDGSFVGVYTAELSNFQAVIDAGKAVDEPLLWGPAQVMRSLIFGYVTDVWGDVPYSEALKLRGEEPILLPAYDPQKDIYAGLFADLSEAVTAMSAGGVQGLGDADPIYGGDGLKWQRFGNSLRARHAMRLANVDAATAKAQLSAAIAAPGGLIQSNADNAQIAWPGDGIYDNPWSANNKSRDDHRLSKTLVDVMLPYDDPRLGVYGQPTQCFVQGGAGCPANPPKYAGLVNGLSATDAAAFAKITSRPGMIFYSTPDFCVGCPALPGATTANFIMTYAEVSFILAEAAQRGWIGGSAANYYAQGIRASMEQWGVTDDAAINAYLAKPSIAYQPGTPGLRQIALQKWLALFTDGVQGWSEWRRTCVPESVKPGPDAVINTVPRRYQYSTREHSVNAANVDAAVARQGGEDSFTVRMYWDSQPAAAPTYPGPSCGAK